jgi:hypothetical protein
MSRLLETIAYGRALAKKEGPRTNISWSLDKQTLDLNKQLIGMHNYRSMVWLAIQDAQTALRQLMFNWEPAIDLSTIQDSLVNDRVGWSFLSEPANGLQHSFQHLQQRAWHSRDGGLMAKQRWVPSKVAKYLQQVAAFKPLLLLCIHLTGGMPGRGTEMGTIKWCNTRTSMRGVFVLHALLLIILEYQKAQCSTNRAFYVVRALPPVVSQLLFRYLAFVRPFAEALSHQVDQLGRGKPESVPYIFATDSRAPFQASQLTAVLKKDSERTCSATLTVASNRQTALAIAKQHIVPMAQPFDARKPEQICQIWQDIAWQAAHHVRTLTGSYALDRSFPAQLQPELIGRYLALSALWHRWLQLERLEQKQREAQKPVLEPTPGPATASNSGSNSGPIGPRTAPIPRSNSGRNSGSNAGTTAPILAPIPERNSRSNLGPIGPATAPIAAPIRGSDSGPIGPATAPTIAPIPERSSGSNIRPTALILAPIPERNSGSNLGTAVPIPAPIPAPNSGCNFRDYCTSFKIRSRARLGSNLQRETPILGPTPAPNSGCNLGTATPVLEPISEPDLSPTSEPELDSGLTSEPEPEPDSGLASEPELDSGLALDASELELDSGLTSKPELDSGLTSKPELDSGLTSEPELDSGLYSRPISRRKRKLIELVEVVEQGKFKQQCQQQCQQQQVAEL